MKSSIPPQIGERFFLYHREVVVTQTYVVFHLVKIKYLGESNEFYIDYHALTSKPSYVNSIGINKLRGDYLLGFPLNNPHKMGEYHLVAQL